MIGIYKITSPSGKVYIGQSNRIHTRFRYYRCLRNSKKQVKLHNSFLKYGVDLHTFEVVIECDASQLNDLERYYQDLYNVLKSGLNCKLTTSQDRSGELSQDTKCKISKSLKGRVITQQWRDNLSKAGKGRKPSEKSINRLIDFNKNRVRSEIEKIKLSYNNPTSRIIIDLDTGVFYYSIAELARFINVNPSTLFDRLTERKKYKNKSKYKLL